MGVLLEPTPETGPWSVELFTDRACLRAMAPCDRTNSGRPKSTLRETSPVNAELPALGQEPAEPVFAFAAHELTFVTAALDQVSGDGLYLDFVTKTGIVFGRWSKPVIEAGWVHVPGPVAAAATQVRCRLVEIGYPHVAELRHVLASLENQSFSDGLP